MDMNGRITMKQYNTELHLINSLLRAQEDDGSLELAEEQRLLAALDYIRATSCSRALATGSAHCAEPPAGDDVSQVDEVVARRLDYLVEMMASVQDWQFDLAENQTVLRQEQRRVKKALDKRIPVADKGSFLKGMGMGIMAAPIGYLGAMGLIVLIMKLADLVSLSGAFLGSLIICAAMGLAIYIYAQIRNAKLLNFELFDESDDGYEFADWTTALTDERGDTK